MIISIIGVVVLIVCSAFFSGAETAFTASSEAFMLDKEREEENKRAAIVNRLYKNKERVIITTLIGSNLSNTLGTALATGVLISLFGQEGIVYASIIMTVLVLIYTDMLPKTYSVQHANAIMLAISPLLSFFSLLFKPVVWLLQKIIEISFKMLNIKNSQSKEGVGVSEIRGAIYLYQGDKVKQEKAMLESVLDLADIEVYNVMTHRKNIFSINADWPLNKILEKLKKSQFSRIPVYRNRPENIVGVLRVREFLQAAILNQDKQAVKVDKAMSEPWFIPENTTLKQQLQAFRNRREHFAVVVDEYGALQGIVTLEDVLEEIVGDINDETDISSIDIDGIRQTKNGTLFVDGRVPIRDINRKFDFDLDDDNVVTIAGYLMDLTRSIPQEGQVFVFDNYQFEILKGNKHQIQSIKIVPLNKLGK